MKILKRQFNMTKEQIENNINLMPYHKKYLKLMNDMVSINNDENIPMVEKRKLIRQMRDDLLIEWKKLNE